MRAVCTSAVDDCIICARVPRKGEFRNSSTCTAVWLLSALLSMVGGHVGTSSKLTVAAAAVAAQRPWHAVWRTRTACSMQHVKGPSA